MELENQIIYRMNQRNISRKNQKYILKYIQLNAELFNCIKTEKIAERIIENFSGISLSFENFIFGGYGKYEPTKGKIYLSPILFFWKDRKYKESVILHELDHCACTPIDIKRGFLEFKKEIKKKYKILYRIIPNFILKEIFFKIHYNGTITGVMNTSNNNDYKKQRLLYGIRWDNYLNEGITSFKQIKYSNLAEVKYHYKNDFYKGARMGTECIGDIIGFEELIYLHFNNNLKEIENRFYENTGFKVESLMIRCLEYDRRSSKKRKKGLNKLIESLKLNAHKTNDF